MGTDTLIRHEEITNTDLAVVKRLLKMTHYSHGSYHMLAGTRAPHMVGYNHVHRPAPQGWHENAGRHAEVDLCLNWVVKGHPVYIVGRNRSGSIMRNTEPCSMCMNFLYENEARRVVFFRDRKILSKVLH